MSTRLDHWTPDQLFEDPYPFYAELRHKSPVHFYEPTQEWFITRWNDCQTLGSRSDVFVPSDRFMPMVKTMGVPNVLTMTGAEHSCLRSGIDARLKAEAVDSYIDGLARPIVKERLARIREAGKADLTRDFFEPTSVRCVADALGLVDVDDATLMRWFHALNTGAQNVADDPDVWAMLDGIKQEISETVGRIYDRVVTVPDETIISHMVHEGTEVGQVRTLEELMPSLRVIILGGLQEPGHGAANAAYGLLQDPAQLDAIRQDPAGLALKAFDEGLRWIAPIGVAARLAAVPFEIGGVTIPAGAPVAIVIASANRDESRWDDAEDFRFDRPRKPHAAFAYRPHFCSGHYLSRQMGRIALEECISTLTGLRLAETSSPVISGWRFRGVTKLPVEWDLTE